MKIPHNILVGERAFEVMVEGKKIDGQTYLDTKSLMKAQRKLAYNLVLQADEFNKDIFNFLMNISGYKASKIAELTKVTSAHISKYRRSETDEHPSPMFWQLFRVVMLMILSNGNAGDDINKILRVA